MRLVSNGEEFSSTVTLGVLAPTNDCASSGPEEGEEQALPVLSDLFHNFPLSRHNFL